MSYPHDYESVRAMFWDGKDKNGKQLRLDDKGIKHALARAYLDLTPRTMDKADNAKNTPIAAKKLVDSSKDLIDLFNGYFSASVKSVTEFDDWHKKACGMVINILKSNGYSEGSATYGKAQKVINMTFKGCFCLEGTKDKEEYFEHCHMPLDSIILDWFWRNVVPHANDKELCHINEGKYKTPSKRATMLYKCNLPTWSNMQKTAKSYVCGYDCFVWLIREYFKNAGHPYKDLTPFKAEFFIWPEMQWLQAAEAFCKQSLSANLSAISIPPSLENDALRTKINEAKAKLAEVEKFYI